MTKKNGNELKHRHGACVACLHQRAHGLHDGFGEAWVTLWKAGYREAAEVLAAREKRMVNRMVWGIGKLWGLDPDELSRLMRHHRSRTKTGPPGWRTDEKR